MLGWSDNPRGEIAGLLDVGTSKVACMIIACGEPHRPHVLALANHRSAGIQAGVVRNPHAIEQCIRAAVDKAEKQANVRLEDVRAGLSCGRLETTAFRASAPLPHGRVDREAVARLQTAAGDHIAREGRIAIDLGQPAYDLDRQPYRAAPLGAPGRLLRAEYRAITADDGPVDALAETIEASALGIADLAPSGLASAYAVTTAQDRRFGVTVVDMGAGCMHVATFYDDAVADYFVLTVGGGHITSLISQAFGMSAKTAERIKVLHGAATPAHADALATFTFDLGEDAQIDSDDLGTATKAELAEVIAPRLTHQLGLLGERLAQADLPDVENTPVVLTGGASGLPGLPQVAGRILNRTVMLGQPAPIPGMAHAAQSGALATISGLAAMASAGRASLQPWLERPLRQSYFDRVQEWVRESF